ncbi:MAG: hypothetical protein ACKVS8_10805 [Phycisphaerales bacterium]
MSAKTPFKLLAAFVVLVVAIVAVLFTGLLYINTLVVKGVERGGTYALGTGVHLRNTDIRLFAGTMALKGFRIDNPKGYAKPSFFFLDTASTAITLSTLNQPVIEVPSLRLEKIVVVIERKDGKANYQVMLDHLASVTNSGGKTTPAPSGKSEKRLIIKDLLITNVNVEAELFDAPGPLGEIVKGVSTVKVPTIKEIRLQNVGRTGTGIADSGVTPGELCAIIVRAVLGAAADAGGGILPADLVNDLQGSLAKIGNLSELGITVTGGLDGAAKAATEQATKAVQDTLKDAEKKVMDGLGKGLGDLLPGAKKPEPKKP